MESNEFSIGKEVVAKINEDKEVRGILKGINESYDGKVTATVEYLIPTRSNFELDKIN